MGEILQGWVPAESGPRDAELEAGSNAGLGKLIVTGKLKANSGVDIGDVTVNNTAASPVMVQGTPSDYSSTQTATIANSAALSGEIDYRGKASGILHMPATWTAASIGFYVAPTSGGTFQPLYDSAGALVEMAVAVNKSYQLPYDKLLGARYLKLWSETAGSGVNQNGARSIVLDLV
jgi:hypothetical protein